MRNSIKHFIWGYQQFFRSSVEIGAERILASLKPDLRTSAFLVGVRIDDDPAKHPACVEPEVHHWAESAELYEVLADVPVIQESYPESQLRHSHPIAQERAKEGLFRRALRDAVMRRLEACESFPEDTRLFSSWPVERDGYLVMTVIGAAKSVLDAVPTIEPGRVKLHEYRSIPVPCSLVEAVIEQILEEAQEQITQTDAGAGLSVLGSTDQLVQRAGLRFFSGLLFRTDPDSLYAGLAEQVFDRLARLALAPYERAEAEGRLSLAGAAARFGEVVLSLAQAVPLDETRALRKMLVLTDDEVVLRCTCTSALALVRVPTCLGADTPSGVEIRIAGRGQWSVWVASRELMVMRDGHPSLPQPIVDEDRVRST